MIFAIIILQAITVVSGTVTDADGNKIEVGSGTFLPSPQDKELAKKVIDMEYSLKQADVAIDSLMKQISTIEDACQKKEKEYLDKVIALERRIESLDNWWNEWGKIVFPCALTGGLGGWIGYEIGR